jgi:hypothetical protein
MRFLAVFAVVAGSLWGQTGSAGVHGSQGWTSLFDGRSLTGWHPEQGAKWRVSGGVLISDGGADGWLRSEHAYTDFLLKIDYRNSPRGNSGVFLRATRTSNLSDPSNPAGGYELQINNEDKRWATGSIENFIQRLVAVSPAPNQWHSYEVEVRGDHITATLDGQKVLDGRNSQFKSGFIGLQHHQDNKIEFRNIEISSISEP